MDYQIIMLCDTYITEGDTTGLNKLYLKTNLNGLTAANGTAPAVAQTAGTSPSLPTTAGDVDVLHILEIGSHADERIGLDAQPLNHGGRGLVT